MALMQPGLLWKIYRLKIQVRKLGNTGLCEADHFNDPAQGAESLFRNPRPMISNIQLTGSIRRRPKSIPTARGGTSTQLQYRFRIETTEKSSAAN